MSVQTIAVVPHYKYEVVKQQTVGTSSAQMTQYSLSDLLSAGVPVLNNIMPRPDNIFLQAAPGNSGTITVYAGNPAVAGVGKILSAGSNISLPIRDASKWYVVASGAGQTLDISYQWGVD